MSEQKVSLRYAKAIIETAEAEKLTDLLYKDLIFVRGICESSHELKVFIKSPVVHEKKKDRIIDEICKGKIDPITLNFLKFMITKGRGELILDVIEQYENLYFKLNNKIRVDITSAVELNEELKNEIIKKIAENTKQTVLPDFNIKKDIKGGLLVKIHDWVFDATLKSQLQQLYNRLSSN